MEHVLPPLVEKYPGQLDFIGIDVTKVLGQNLFEAAIIQYQIPANRTGIPTLVVDDILLIGTKEISQELPKIIKGGLDSGGISWPDIPGLKQVLEASPELSNQREEPVQELNGGSFSSETPAFVIRFANDLLANHIAVLVLLGMIACAVIVGVSFIKDTESKFLQWSKWITPVLTLIGLGIALYLSYIEYSQTDAICGPVGNCNAVQRSPYAQLFGIIPVGALGVIGYLFILISWLLKEFGPQTWRKFLALGIWGMSWFGVFFSIYLTFLEPFVIGATCAWCISSAIIMTLILLATTDSAKRAFVIEEEVELDDEDLGESEEIINSTGDRA